MWACLLKKESDCNLSLSHCMSLYSLSPKLVDFNKFALSSRQCLSGVSSWQANQREREHEIVPFLPPAPPEWNGSCGGSCVDECVPMTTMWVFCSRGGMKVIQVLWFPNGPERERGRGELRKRGETWQKKKKKKKNYRVREWSGKDRWVKKNRFWEEWREKGKEPSEKRKGEMAWLGDKNRLLFFWFSGSVDWTGL